MSQWYLKLFLRVLMGQCNLITDSQEKEEVLEKFRRHPNGASHFGI